MGEDIKWRIGDHRFKLEIQDVIDLLLKCDEDDIKIPKFVADSYDALPPTAGFGKLACAIMTLMDEV
ncbi:unnamed protein product, partial [Rotaria magnacalcarata]